MPTTRIDSVTAPDGRTFDADVVVPDGGRGPGVLLLQEIFGVNDFLLGKARDLAALGYVVSCPEVFHRVERGVRLPHDDDSMQAGFGYIGRYLTEVEDETKVADLLAALDHLRGLPETTGKVGVMGYCLGGLLSYLVAAYGTPDACVSYYGSSTAQRLALADDITCPICFHFGDHDEYIPTADVEQVRKVFDGRPGAEVHVYEGAGHAFENLLAPRFANPDAAARSWPVTVEFLARTLRD
jgi:carboxymethylenebutenolidase